MTAVITNGTTGASGSFTAAGPVRVVASGVFTAGASIDVDVNADSLGSDLVSEIKKKGGIRLSTATGDIVTATIKKGGGGTSISVSISAV